MMLTAIAILSKFWMLLSCFMVLSQVQGKDSPKDIASPQVSCPNGSQPFGTLCYALSGTPKSWMDADLACQKWPTGHLVSVLSAAEAYFVSSLVTSTVNNYQYVWIGLHDPTLGKEPNGAGWAWSNTDVLNYLNWERNLSTVAVHGYCGSLSRYSGFLKWRDQPCVVQLPYVCKFKI
ncbi:regenerating islet-derived protein 3-beta-like isoform X1 [Castor canadensis]|uniref:Regenerating islet-derived protein 3-beta-like n=2 Tax=Castor canadensis TaxID=51338 RepID=A0A8B7TQQ6_CASCN|nr:regenerating islet-derived protein 3-beta-like [Castor canadensis]